MTEASVKALERERWEEDGGGGVKALERERWDGEGGGVGQLDEAVDHFRFAVAHGYSMAVVDAAVECVVFRCVVFCVRWDGFWLVG